MLASIDNINDIAQLYIEYLQVPSENVYNVRDGIKKFLYKHLDVDVYVSCIYQNDDIVSMAIMTKRIFIPDKNLYTKNGDIGVIQNIYTKPEFRNRRFASGCINELISLAYEKKFINVGCKTSQSMSSLLEKLGFDTYDFTLKIKQLT